MKSKYQTSTLSLFIVALAIAYVETSAVFAASGCLPAHEIQFTVQLLFFRLL